MELQIKKWGVLRDSTIPLPGLTVITGYNATGKSTVGKLLLAMVKAAQVWREIDDGQIVQRFFAELAKEIAGESEHGSFSLVESDNCEIRIDKLDDISCSKKENARLSFLEATMLETPFVAVMASFFASVQRHISQKIEHVKIPYPYAMNDAYGKMIDKKKGYSEIALKISKLIEERINGGLDYQSAGFVFVEKRGDKELRLDPKGVAAGQLGLAVFAKLLENGWVANDTISIFDEPESHMHPHWQLIYADLLVRCVEELGATIVVTTHTPYMLQALKVFSDQRIKDKAAFCLAERKGDHAQITVDDSPDLAKIAPLMTEPMRRIQLLRDWDYDS